MKKKNLIMRWIIVTTVLLLIPLSTLAAPIPTYSGAWDTNSEDAFFIEIIAGDGDGSLWMYDWSDTTKNLKILDDIVFQNNTVNFLQSGGNWYASLDETISGVDLLLGNDTIFGLYFYDGSTKYTSYNYYPGNDSYTLSSSATGMTIVAHDIDPVPIPATVWIFGSGLIGIVVIRRKFKK